jgi:predicted PurR-regulated permease PerM
MALDETDERFVSRALEATIRIGLLLVLLGWCFTIIRPFVGPVAWGMIIAVAVHPAYARLRSRIGGRSKSAAGLLAVGGLVLLLVPAWMLGGTVFEGAQTLVDSLQEGRVAIPPLPESVAGWPIVGARIAEFWGHASENLLATLKTFEPQLLAFGGWVLSSAASSVVTVLLFVVSIVIAAVLLANDAAGRTAALTIGERITGGQGEEFVSLAGATVQSVAQGILGVALTQSLLAGAGFLLAGVPGAGLWALIVLFFCVIQVGPVLVFIPVLVWAWSAMGTTGAAVFTIWCVFVAILDNFLKPLLLGRGVKVPTVVIFLGAIGGFLSAGIIGLFVGSVVLVLGYTLFMEWLEIQQDTAEPGVEPSTSLM